MGWQSTVVKPTVTQGTIDGILRAVWLTDYHLSPTISTRLTNFQVALDFAATKRPAAFIDSGDSTEEGQQAMLDLAYYKLQDARAEWNFRIPGNHDLQEPIINQLTTALLEAQNSFNRPHPFWYSQQISSGDRSLKALLLGLNNNFYNGFATPDPNRTLHNPIGTKSGDPAGGPSRELGAAQLQWVADTLAADKASSSPSDHIVVVTHYNGAVYDYDQLADKLYADGRPAFGLCGHTHPNAVTTTITTTTGGHTFTLYKAPAMQESGAYVWMEWHMSGGAIVFDTLQVRNYTNPGGWTINAPFTT